MRNYKKISECPDEFKQIIFWANQLANDDVETTRYLEKQIENLVDKSVDTLSYRFENDTLITSWNPYIAENYQKYDLKKMKDCDLKIELRKIISNKNFYNYLASEEPFSIVSAYNKFIDLITARKFLISVCKANQREAFPFPDTFFFSKGYKLTVQDSITEKGLIKTFIPGNFMLDKKGYIRPNLFGLAELFRKYDISFERIRFCPICEEIFWAKRLDAKSCGKPQCATNLSKRTSRKIRREKILQLKDELSKEIAKLEKLKVSLNGGNGLIDDQQNRVDELKRRIAEEEDSK